MASTNGRPDQSGPSCLITALSEACSSAEGFGSMSPSIYDTAWLAMIEKPIGSGQWLFPECFEYILQHQSISGDWPSYATVADGILNTAAALLAIKKHLMWDTTNKDLELLCNKAHVALESLLGRWEISSCDQVGFEILVTQHINLLAAEGVSIAFSGLPKLQAVCHDKHGRLSSLQDLLYNEPSTLLHSLESQVGLIDFDRLRCWREPNGSMMNSPSSTAAYLMHASEWDQDAERYLRTVLRQGPSQSKACVPCAWPTTLFEASWTVTTLAHAGIPIQVKESAVLRKLLQHALSEGQGRVGFTASSLVPDADDTAKAIMALRYLGETDVSVRPLVETFECRSHFLTYPGERNPSFSTNCNILMCLGMLEDPLPYKSQIIKTARFLCDQVYQAQIIDKWHRSQLYSIMLLSQALEQLYSSSNTALLSELSIEDPILFPELIPIISIQVLIMTLSSQEEDGSWEGMCELTAYAILALSSLAHLPWLHCELDMYGIVPCIKRAKSYLKAAGQGEWVKGKRIWIEKVTYASPLLSEIYCQAATQVPLPKQHGQRNGSSTSYSSPVLPNPKVLGGMRKAGALMARTALLGPSKLQQNLLAAAELQAVYALCELERRKLEVFPLPPSNNNNGDWVKKDTYLMFVPLTWTACGALHGGTAASLYVLREMMVISMLVYQADEYIEGVVEQSLDMPLNIVRRLVTRIIRDEQASPPNSEAARLRNGGHNAAPGHAVNSSLADTESVLRKFVLHVLRHPSVLICPAQLQARLAGEVEAFLLAHLMQAEDNRALSHRRKHGKNEGSHLGSNGFRSGSASMQNGDTSLAIEEATNGQQCERHHPSAGSGFYSWVRSTSAEHTSCPCAFFFFDCLVVSSSPSHSFFDLFGRSAKTAYVAEDLCRHLASMCRMYNDYASVARDRLEGNLNSVDFSEFRGDGQQGGGDASIEDSKAQLMWIAEYERKGMDVAMARLEEEMDVNGRLGQDLLDAVKLFVSVTDLYGQVYVIRDITNHVK